MGEGYLDEPLMAILEVLMLRVGLPCLTAQRRNSTAAGYGCSVIDGDHYAICSCGRIE
jgi:hypothetical protein